MPTFAIRIIFNCSAFILSASIWYNLYISQYHEYDDNIADIIMAFLLSLVSFIVLLLLWFYKRNILLANKLTSFLFFVLNSPISIIFAFIYYHEIFETIQR